MCDAALVLVVLLISTTARTTPPVSLRRCFSLSAQSAALAAVSASRAARSASSSSGVMILPLGRRLRVFASTMGARGSVDARGKGLHVDGQHARSRQESFGTAVEFDLRQRTDLDTAHARGEGVAVEDHHHRHPRPCATSCRSGRGLAHPGRDLVVRPESGSFTSSSGLWFAAISAASGDAQGRGVLEGVRTVRHVERERRAGASTTVEQRRAQPRRTRPS